MKHKNTGLVSTIIILLGGSAALASTGHYNPSEGIPRVVLFQAINLSILIFGFYYFLKDKVSDFFVGRHDNLQRAIVEAKKLKDEAHAEHHEVRQRLATLQASADDTIKKTKEEAAALLRKTADETARAVSAIELEARRAAEREISRATEILFEHAADEAMVQARKLLNNGVVDKDQRRLQKEFVEKVEAVN